MADLERHELSIELPADDRLGERHVAATLICAPESWPPPVVLFTFPGGGYGRRYFDLDLPGLPGYSQADYHASRGWAVVTVDHLGVGESSLPDPELLSFEACATANDETVTTVMGRLSAGTLVDGLPALAARPFVIGAGQSMGGCLSIVAQANHRTFDALAVLGFSAIHTALPTPDQGSFGDLGTARGEQPDLAAASVELSLSGAIRYAFHWDDELEDIVAADVEGYPLRLDGVLPSWASAAVPPAAVTMLNPGVVSTEAARIDVPVFVLAGERDVIPDLHAEPAAYSRSPDVTVVMQPASAHMHNFAGTREQGWRRLHLWGGSVRPDA